MLELLTLLINNPYSALVLTGSLISFFTLLFAFSLRNDFKKAMILVITGLVFPIIAILPEITYSTHRKLVTTIVLVIILWSITSISIKYLLSEIRKKKAEKAEFDYSEWAVMKMIEKIAIGSFGVGALFVVLIFIKEVFIR